jgi:CRISPR system Cascade subunit CasA
MEELGLRQVLLQAHKLRMIQGDSPLETAAIYRLLLAVLHSALRGPRTMDDWGELWERGYNSTELINTYLDHWVDRFDLFHSQRPFYQAPDGRVKPKSVTSLVLDMVSGNNAVLFDHHMEDEGVSITPAKAARTLIVAQTFGLAGLSGIPGQAFTDAPWARGIVFLVEDDDLFKSLVLNLLPYPDEVKNNVTSSQNDRPAWEQEDPYLPERQIPLGYLDYLTWQNRRVLLNPEGSEEQPSVRTMTVAPGLRLAASFFDPFKLFREGKAKGEEQVWLCTRYSEDRVLWRNSAALFGIKSTNGKTPQTFNWLAVLAGEGYISWQKKLRFAALGMANDQAKVEFFQEDHLPLIVDYLRGEELVEGLKNCLEKAETSHARLRSAAQWLALLIISPQSDGKTWKDINKENRDQAGNLVAHWNVDRFYWQQLELPFFHLLQDLPQNRKAMQAWDESVQHIAWEALERTIGFAGTSTDALKAAVRARGMLGAMLKELIPE